MKGTGIAVALCAFTLGLAPLGACSRVAAPAGADASADADLDAGPDVDAMEGEAEADAMPWYMSSDASASCGYKPPGDAAAKPDCPLQSWMKRHSRVAITRDDIDELTATFNAIAELAPTDFGYERWADIAHDGAHAARRGDLEGAKAACRGCHESYRTRYHALVRARPLNDPSILERDAAIRDAKSDH